MDFSISPTPTGVKIEGNNGVTTKTLLEFDNDGKVIGGEISDEVLKPSFNATGLAPIYACRAWVNFNGTGVVAIRASGNVSSITDNGTGVYTVNLATAMPDVNYAVVSSGKNVTTTPVSGEEGTRTLSAVTIAYAEVDGAWGRQDNPEACVSIFR